MQYYNLYIYKKKDNKQIACIPFTFPEWIECQMLFDDYVEEIVNDLCGKYKYRYHIKTEKIAVSKYFLQNNKEK